MLSNYIKPKGDPVISKPHIKGQPVEGAERANLTARQLRTFDLVTRSPTEEVLTQGRLASNIVNGVPLVHYIGYEISGYVHLGTGLLGMSKLADFQEASAKTTVFLADYHTWINKKLGGDLSTIRRVAGTYFKEALKASIRCVGGDPEKVDFVLGSDLYAKLGTDYLESLLKAASGMSLGRAKRSVTILGRREGEDLSLAQMIYVPMQVADVFSLGANLPHSGMDQRKAHVVAIDVSGNFPYEPVAVHHHLLMGIHINEEQRKRILAAKQSGNREAFEGEIVEVKMSKSNPNSAVFIHDSEEQIRRKITGAFCPNRELDVNPIIDMQRYIVWPYLVRRGVGFELVNTKTKATTTYKTVEELEAAYVHGAIHPADFKASVASYLIEILEPARKYFSEGMGARYLEEMKDIKVTR